VDWELKGVPVRVEVGPRDLATGNVTVVTRHLRTKVPVALGGVADAVARVCARAGTDLRDEALAFREARTAPAATLDEAVAVGTSGFARVPWRAVGEAGEMQLAAESLTVRCLQHDDGTLAAAGEADDDLVAVVGRTY